MTIHKITTNISAGNRFLSRLSDATKQRLSNLTGQEIEPFEPAVPKTPLETPRNREQKRRINSRDNRRTVTTKLSPRQAKAHRRRLSQRKDLRYIDTLRRRLIDRGVAPRVAAQARAFPSTVWAMNAHILADASGKAARLYLRRCYHQIGARIVEKSAKGDSNRSLGHPVARKIVALGLSMLALSRETRRKGLWGRIIKAVPMTAWSALLRDPYTTHKPSLSSISGYHGREGKTAGYLDALRANGLFYSQQLPKTAVEPIEALGDYSVNRYWIITAGFHGPLSAGEINELLTVYPYSTIRNSTDLSRSHPPDYYDKQAPGFTGIDPGS